MTSLALCLPSKLTANIKFTLICWWLGGAFRIHLWFESHLALWHVVKIPLMQSISSLIASDRIPPKKEPCLTPTLMDEGQARNPNTTYNGYKMEFWKFALTWKLICPVQHKITQKRTKRNNQERRNILNHNGPKANLQLNT